MGTKRLIKHTLNDIGRTIESAGKYLRPYLYPSLHRFVRELREQNKESKHQSGPIALFDISSAKIDRVAGRYFYHIGREFFDAGYQLAYKDRFRFLATFKTARYRGFLLELPFSLYQTETDVIHSNDDLILITDQVKVFNNSSIRKKVLISYEHRRAKEGEIPLTFGIAPNLYRISASKPSGGGPTKRDMRIYFAGNTASGYSKDLLNQDYGMPNRRQVIDCVHEHFSDRLYVPPPALEPNEALPETPHPITLVSSVEREIPAGQWLDTMARCEFFLACPGVRMPMCHNLIEALSVGSIPILEYETYLEPGLEDNVNCVSYRGTNGLVEAIERVLAMTDSEISKLREGVIDFYQKHYSPGRMAERIIASADGGTTLVMNDYRVRR